MESFCGYLEMYIATDMKTYTIILIYSIANALLMLNITFYVTYFQLLIKLKLCQIFYMMSIFLNAQSEACVK